MTAGSPPASVSVPAAPSSSSSRKSQPANLLSSSNDFSSAPSSEDAPVITIRLDSRSMEGMNHAVRETSRCRRKRTTRSEEHTSELQSLTNLVCRLLLEKKKRQQPQPRAP